MVLMRYWIAFFVLLILTGCGGGGSSSSTGGGSSSGGNIPIPPNITLERVEIVPASAQVPLGIALDLQLYAIYSNGVRIDVTSAASFASNNTTSFSVSNQSARALALGNAQITGSFQGQSATAQLQATSAQLRTLSLQPPTATVAAGLSQTYQVLATFSDNSQLDVTSTATLTVVDGNVARLDAPGRVLTLRAGNTEVRANLNNQQASASLTVTAARLERLEVTPSTLSIPLGLTQNFVATGYFSDGSHRDITTDAEWESNDSNVFFVANLAGNKGQGGALAEGSARVSATVGSISGSSQVSVTAAVLQSLTVAPSGVQLPVGLSQAFTASGRFSDGTQRPLTDQVIWSSTNSGAASISNAPGSNGQATGVQVGSTKIRAELGSVTAEVDLEVVAAVLQSIEVSPAGQSLPLGFTLQFSATGTYSDGVMRSITNQVSWTTSNPARASIDGQGLVTAAAEGTVDIQAQLDSVQGKTLLTITPAVLQSLVVTPSQESLPKGASRQFNATGTFSDQSERNLNSEVTWSSQDEAVATVSNQSGSQGLVTAVKPGSTTIQAQLGSSQATAQLTVTAAVVTGVEFVPSNPSQPKGSLVELHLLARYSDGTVVDFTGEASTSFPMTVISSDDPDVAEIRNNTSGLANLLYFKNTGTTQIHVTGSNYGNASTTVTVTNAQLVSLEVTPNGDFLTTGQSQELTALGHYTDTSVLDLTQQVSWSSSDEATATVSNAPGSQGLWTAGATGQATVQASLDGIQGQTLVRVNDDEQVGMDWVWRQGRGPQMLSLTAGNGVWLGIDNFRSFISSDGRNWRSNYLLPQGSITGQGTGPLAYGGGIFLAHTGGSNIVRSADGRNWTPVTLPKEPGVVALAYGNGRFVALGNDVSLISDDLGQSWTLSAIVAGSRQLEYVNGRFYNMGTSTLVSTTGDSWQAFTLPAGFQARSLAFDGTLYMVAGTGGRIYSSPDLVNFSLQTVPGATRPFVKVLFGAGGFVAIDDRGAKFSTVSGPDWTAVGQNTAPLLGYRSDVGFLAPGGISPTDYAPQLSADGVNWETLTPVSNDLSISEGPAISFGPLGFMLSDVGKFFLSNDGLSWTSRPTTGLSGGLSLIQYLGGHYYLSGSLNETQLHRSDNGLDYRSLFEPLGGQLAYGKGRHIHAGTPARYSDDGIIWPSIPTSRSYYGAAFGGGRFVLTGTNGAAYSDNGLNFTEVSVPNADMREAAYAFGRFVTVTGTQILTSTDGSVWTQVSGLPAQRGYRGLCVGNGLIIAYGAGITYSRDGIHWTQSTDTSFEFNSMAAGFGKFVGVSPGVGVVTSP